MKITTPYIAWFIAILWIGSGLLFSTNSDLLHWLKSSVYRAPSAGNVVLTSTSCTIPIGQSTCSIGYNVSVSNLVSPNQALLFRSENGVRSGSKSFNNGYNQKGTFPLLKLGTSSFDLYDGTKRLYWPSYVTATCAAGSTWNGTKCDWPTSTLSVNSATCTIPIGQSNCNSCTIFNWVMSNLPTWKIFYIALFEHGQAQSNLHGGTQINVNWAFNSACWSLAHGISYGKVLDNLVNVNAANIISPTITVTSTCAAGGTWNAGTSKCQ